MSDDYWTRKSDCADCGVHLGHQHRPGCPHHVDTGTCPACHGEFGRHFDGCEMTP